MREVALVKNKTDKSARFIKAAIRVVIGAAIVLVFIRNAFPETKQAIVIDEEASSAQSEIPVRNGALSLPESSPIAESAFSSAEDYFPPDNSEIIQSSFDIIENSSDSPVTEPDVSPKININEAPAGELVKLYGIGEAKAAAIIRYRNENGGFKSVDELINVSGIGEKTLAKIRDYVTV